MRMLAAIALLFACFAVSTAAAAEAPQAGFLCAQSRGDFNTAVLHLNHKMLVAQQTRKLEIAAYDGINTKYYTTTIEGPFTFSGPFSLSGESSPPYGGLVCVLATSNK